MTTIKQIIVIRRKFIDKDGKEFSVRRGKEIAQGCHASCAFLTNIIRNNLKLTDVQESWIKNKFTKICVQVDSEQDLLKVYNDARENGLESFLIQDSGLTEFEGVPTYTCLAIGPDLSDKIDKITGHLKLY